MLKGMDYIYAVYEARSFSKAAEKLYISQPALSNTIKKVEQELGMRLFDRSASPVRLTQAGEYYIRCIEKVRLLEAELNTQLEELRHSKNEKLTIGAGSFFCAHLLPKLAQQFEQSKPGCRIQLNEMNVRDLLTGLQQGTLDLTMDTEAWDEPRLTTVFLCREHILLAVPAALDINQRLASYRLSFEQVRSGMYLEPDTPAVNLGEFCRERFILLREGNDIYRRALTMCRSAGFTPIAEMYLDQLYTSYCVARDGRGIAFVRAGITHAVSPTDQIYFYKIDDPTSRRDVFLHYLKASPDSALRDGFIEYMKQNAPGPLR